MVGLYHAVLAAVFLAMLNGFLKGAWNAQVDAVLSVIWVGLLLVGFIAFDWRAGILALIFAFIYAGVSSRPMAAANARRLFFLAPSPERRRRRPGASCGGRSSGGRS